MFAEGLFQTTRTVFDGNPSLGCQPTHAAGHSADRQSDPIRCRLAARSTAVAGWRPTARVSPQYGSCRLAAYSTGQPAVRQLQAGGLQHGSARRTTEAQSMGRPTERGGPHYGKARKNRNNLTLLRKMDALVRIMIREESPSNFSPARLVRSCRKPVRENHIGD